MLHFTWTSVARYDSDLYKINILIYDIDYDMDLWLADAEARKGEYSLQCSLLQYKKGPLHVYMGIIDMYRQELSDSVYVGAVE